MTDRQVKLELMDKLEKISKEIAKGNDVYITKSASGVVVRKMTVGKVQVKMGALKRMASKCRNCDKRDSCDYKKMELCAYIEEPPLMASASMQSVAELTQPMMIKHDYRDIKVGENTKITIDVEELKRQMEKEIYKSAGIGLNFGA